MIQCGSNHVVALLYILYFPVCKRQNVRQKFWKKVTVQQYILVLPFIETPNSNAK